MLSPSGAGLTSSMGGQSVHTCVHCHRRKCTIWDVRFLEIQGFLAREGIIVASRKFTLIFNPLGEEVMKCCQMAS